MNEEDIKVGEWQPATEPYHPLPSARVPHLGHALLFLFITGIILLLSQALLLIPVSVPHGGVSIALNLRNQPKLLIAAEAATYLLTLVICRFLFPRLWHRSFADGIAWNFPAARRLALKLIPIGLMTGWSVQAISSLISMPKTVPMDEFFRSTSDVWLVTLFGVIMAPLFEEITFRGFLLPAFTIAFDWLGPMLRYVLQFSLCRLRGELPPEHFVLFPETASAGLAEGTGNLAFRSLPAIILASLVTSALFALLHAQQLGYTWAAVLLLAGVSLLLTLARVRTRSVACSTLVHSCYNLSVFIVVFIVTGGYRHLDRMAR